MYNYKFHYNDLSYSKTARKINLYNQLKHEYPNISSYQLNNTAKIISDSLFTNSIIPLPTPYWLIGDPLEFHPTVADKLITFLQDEINIGINNEFPNLSKRKRKAILHEITTHLLQAFHPSFLVYYESQYYNYEHIYYTFCFILIIPLLISSFFLYYN